MIRYFTQSDTVRISWSIHPHDPGDDGTGDDSNEVGMDGVRDVMEVAVHGERSLLLQLPSVSPIPLGPQIHSWDVLMRNVSNVKAATKF